MRPDENVKSPVRPQFLRIGDLGVPGREKERVGSNVGGIGSPKIDKGLDDVYVMESRICFVDGQKGRLLYYGYDIRDLADHSTFEETAYLLGHGKLPNREQLAAFTAELATNRPIPKGIVSLLKGLPKETAPIDALRPAGREAELPIHDRDGLPPDAEREEAGQADGPDHGRRPHPSRGPLDERGHVRGDGRGLDPPGPVLVRGRGDRDPEGAPPRRSERDRDPGPARDRDRGDGGGVRPEDARGGGEGVRLRPPRVQDVGPAGPHPAGRREEAQRRDGEREAVRRGEGGRGDGGPRGRSQGDLPERGLLGGDRVLHARPRARPVPRDVRGRP